MPLPSSKEVPTFDLDYLFITTDDGGFIVKDTLLKCVTKDTDSNESTLEFVLSGGDIKAEYIKPEAEVKFKGRIYRIRGITETVNYASGKEEVEVFCERLWYNLLYAGQINQTALVLKTASYCVQYALRGTGWSMGEVSETPEMTWDLGQTTVLGALKEIANEYDLTLVMDDSDKTVHMVKNPGRNRGTYFSYEKGLQGVSRRVDTTSMITKIYGRNAEGITIAGVNDGKPYLENYSYTKEERIAVYDFKSGTTPAAMLNFLNAFLASRSKPRISYEYTLSSLSNRTQEIERFEVFDKVFVLDEDYDKSISSRVVSLDIDWINLSSSKVVLDTKLATLSSEDKTNQPGEVNQGNFNPVNWDVPTAPLGLQLTSFGYWWGNSAASQVNAKWRAVTQATSLRPIKISHYIVKISTGRTAYATENNASFDSMESGKTYSVQVRAVSEFGVPGEWSQPASVTTEAPLPNPHPPTNPHLSTSNGVVFVKWDGRLKDDQMIYDAPRYITHVEIEESSTGSAPWRVVAYSSGGVEVLPKNPNTTWYYRLVAIDTLGNRSNPSEVSSVQVAGAPSVAGVEKAQRDADKALKQLAGLESSNLGNQITQTRQTLDGKNSIFTSRNTPPNPSRGDQWWVLNSANRITEVRIWSGSSWQPYSLVASSILVPGSVGTIQLANGAITAEKISVDQALINKLFVDNLLAGKIKSEYLSATALDGKTITGATIRTSSSGKRTEISKEGVVVYDERGRIKVRLGYDSDFGLEIYNPYNGKMSPIGPIIFGASYGKKGMTGKPKTWIYRDELYRSIFELENIMAVALETSNLMVSVAYTALISSNSNYRLRLKAVSRDNGKIYYSEQVSVKYIEEGGSGALDSISYVFTFTRLTPGHLYDITPEFSINYLSSSKLYKFSDFTMFGIQQ